MRIKRVYIGLVFVVLIVILLFTFKDELIQNENAKKNVEKEVANEVVLGSKLNFEYREHQTEIKKGTYVITVYSIKGNPIKYEGLAGFKEIIYAFQNYERYEYIKNDITYVECNLESYTSLKNVLSKAETYNKEKLKLYYEQDVEIVKEETTVNAPRQLKDGELYGSSVKSNFVGHQNDIINGKVYFKVITEGKTMNIASTATLEKEVLDDYIYTKEFELTNAGTLKGYTFTRVMN